MTLEEKINKWDILLGIKQEPLNELDELYKKLSSLILRMGGYILPADEPKQLKIGYVWWIEKNGVEIHEHITIRVSALRKHLPTSKISKVIDSLDLSFYTEQDRSNICKEICNKNSKIHDLYFTQEQKLTMMLEYKMNEALE